MVAFGVEGLFEQPFEYAARAFRVCDTRSGGTAIDAGDVFLRRRTPVDIPVRPHPAFDSCELTFGARAEPPDREFALSPFDPRPLFWSVRYPLQMRHQVFATGHHKNIIFGVCGKSFLGLPSDAGYRELPAEPEWAIAVTGAVLQRQLRPKAVAPR